MPGRQKISHDFYKDFSGLFLFLLCYFAILIQIIGVWLTPILENSWQWIHNFFFYLSCILATISHVRASCEDPGKITKKSNPSTIWLYIKCNPQSILLTNELNKQFMNELKKDIDDKENQTDTEDEDETDYVQETSISQEVVKKLEKDYKIEVSRCTKCYVVKLPKTHHCSKCKG